MAIVEITGVLIDGIVTAVPKNRIDNLNDPNIEKEQGEKILKTTGIRYRRLASDTTTTSDLCYIAAVNLLEQFQTFREDIEILVFVSQTPDYILPATAPILQHKLGLGSNVAAFDMNMGCSGYVYGLSTITSILNNSKNPNAKALLLVGDTVSKLCSSSDSATYPLFGDAGSATLISKSKEGKFIFDLNSDGGGAEAIKVEAGGFRAMTENNTTKYNTTKPSLYLDGMDVFSFGISKVPKSIKSFLSQIDKEVNDFDYFIFHQANMFMNEKIRKKLQIKLEKVPYSLYDFANTSSTTIPLTITTQLKKDNSKNNKVFCCGFGVGLSWANVILDLNKDIYTLNIEIDE